ncbi:MAG: hypothetical protein ACP5RM_00495 [Candidatus Micrarchaeia archaeon]
MGGRIGILGMVFRYVLVFGLLSVYAGKSAFAGSVQVLNTIDGIKSTLTQVGPALSAVLFVIAGIFYAIGQMLPPDKKANFHTASINIIIGAIVVGSLSIASTSLAIASTHLLSNFTNASG